VPVRVDAQLHAGVRRGAGVHVVEVAPPRRTVDLEHRPGARRGVDDRVDVDRVGRALLDQAPRGVADDVDERVLDRADHPRGHRLAVERELRVDRRHDPVEFGEQLVRVVERAVREDVHLAAREQRDPVDLVRHLPHRRHVLLELVRRDVVAEAVARRVIGDREVLVPERKGCAGHLLDRVATVAGGRVGVEVAPKVVERHERRWLEAGCKFSPVLAEFRLEVRESEEGVDLLLRLAVVRLAGGVVENAVLADVEAALHGRLAQRDVVLLAPGEVLQQVPELLGRDDLEVDRQTVVRAALRPGRPKTRCGLEEVEVGERRRQRRGVLRRGDDVQILHAVAPASRGAGELDAVRRRVRAQHLEKRLGDRERVVQRHTSSRRLSGPGLERGEHGLLELRPEALDAPQLLPFRRGLQRVERVDSQLVEQLAGALGPEPGEARHRDEARRELRPELRDRRYLAGLDERHELLLERLPDPGDLRHGARARPRGDGRRGVAHGLCRVAVRSDAMDDRAVQFVEIAQLVEDGGNLGVRRVGHRDHYPTPTP
jgi:hypothetical protein